MASPPWQARLTAPRPGSSLHLRVKGVRLRITVVASMRNEGAFIVEWLAWYKMLGFTDVVVVTNACTDRSPQLLDALQAAGRLHHIRHEVPPGSRITEAKLAAAREHKSVRRAQWVFVCDADEFLVIHKGSGKISELIGPPDAPPFLAMALTWRVFGTCGVTSYQDLPVHQQFSLARPQASSLSQWVKMLFRQPRWFTKLAEHGPKGLLPEKAALRGTDPGLRLVTADGREVPDWDVTGRRYLRRLPKALVSHEVAQVNHYMLRSAESFSLKAGTSSPVALADRYTNGYFQRADGGRMPDSSAFRYADEFEAMRARLMALPDVARLHALCCADHMAAICEKAGRRPEDEPRWQAFMAQAPAS